MDFACRLRWLSAPARGGDAQGNLWLSGNCCREHGLSWGGSIGRARSAKGATGLNSFAHNGSGLSLGCAATASRDGFAMATDAQNDWSTDRGSAGTRFSRTGYSGRDQVIDAALLARCTISDRSGCQRTGLVVARPGTQKRYSGYYSTSGGSGASVAVDRRSGAGEPTRSAAPSVAEVWQHLGGIKRPSDAHWPEQRGSF